jgi:hypothetical protein
MYNKQELHPARTLRNCVRVCSTLQLGAKIGPSTESPRRLPRYPVDTGTAATQLMAGTTSKYFTTQSQGSKPWPYVLLCTPLPSSSLSDWREGQNAPGLEWLPPPHFVVTLQNHHRARSLAWTGLLYSVHVLRNAVF